MGNTVNAFDFDDSLAVFLAGAVSDGTFSDVIVTLKFDEIGNEALASQIDAAGGQLWSNVFDDYLQATYPTFYRATKIWRRADAAARDALGSDDDLAVDDIGYTEDINDFFYVVSVDGPAASTWALVNPKETTTGAGPDGAHTVVGTETLTADVAYTTLIVPDGTVLQTNGFKVGASVSITIGSTGVIRSNGADGVDDVAGAGASGGSLGAGTAGGTGGSFGAGSAGVAPVADTSAGSSGGAGGAGDGGAGGAAGVPDPPNAIQGSINLGLPHHAVVIGANGGAGGLIVLSGGTGGGGGAGNGVNRPGGGGGGGAGVLVLSTPKLINNGTIEAVGGDGGDGTVANNTGGGGGGGGGLVISIARSRSGSGTISVAGGGGGAAGGTGVAGAAGSTGTVQEYDG